MARTCWKGDKQDSDFLGFGRSIKHTLQQKRDSIRQIAARTTRPTRMTASRSFFVFALVSWLATETPTIVAAAEATLTNASTSNQKTWTLFHAWQGQDFTPRGQVSLSLEQGGDGLALELTNHAAPQLIDGPWYQLKLVEDSDRDPPSYAMTTISACQLRRANFRDEITLTFGPHAEIVSLTHASLVSPLAPPCEALDPTNADLLPSSFTSKISYETSTPGMVLPIVLPNTKPSPGLKFFPRSKGSGGMGGMGMDEPEPINSPQSFLKRYWYYILPIFIMTMLQGGGEAEAPAGDEGGDPKQPASLPNSSGGATRGGATVAAAASPAGSSGPRRRGKRN